jgi:hypothetical protein
VESGRKMCRKSTMRPWHRNSLALLLIAYASAARPVAPSQLSAAPFACDVAVASAQAMIAEDMGHPVFATEGDGIRLGLPRNNVWVRPWGKKTIPKTPSIMLLMKRLHEQAGQNAVARCASVRKMLTARGIGYGPPAVKAARSRNSRQATSIYILSHPVVSPDGRQALLLVGFSEGGLVSSTFLQLLERHARGGWKVVGEAPLLVG